MDYKFDSATGFLITKAMQRLLGDSTIKQDKNVNVKINMEAPVPDNYLAKGRKPKAVKPRRQSSTPKMARPNQYNPYSASSRAINTGGKLFGGELFGVFNEIRNAVSTPMRMAGGLIGKYQDKRQAKADRKYEEMMSNENGEQTDRLEDILKEIKQKGGHGGGGLFGGKTGMLGLGAIGGFLFKGGIKGFLKKLGIAGLVYSVIDGYSKSIEDFKGQVGKGMSENLTLSEKMQFASNQIGKTFAGMVNAIAGHTVISDEEVEGFTAEAKKRISTALDNLKDNYPKVGGAIADSLTELDSVMGNVTSYLGDASKVLMDAFRKKTDLEKEFIKAQDIVRNRDTFGETLSGTNNAEYEQAKAKMRELAPELLKDKEFVENSAYAQTAKDAIDPAVANKAKKKKQQAHYEEIVSEVDKRKLKVQELEELKKGLENDEFMAKTKLAMFYASQDAFEAELKAKKFQLEQQQKLADLAKKIVDDTEKIVNNVVSVEAVSNAVTGATSAIFTKSNLSVKYNDGTTKTGGHRNWRNNNAGNLEYGSFAKRHGAIGTDGRFAIFPSMEAGYKAQSSLLKTKGYRNKTLSGAINKYAPSHENDVGAYVSSITRRTGISANTKMSSLTDEQLDSVVRAMAKHEGMKAGTVTSGVAKATVIAKAVKAKMKPDAKQKKVIEDVAENAVKAKTPEVKTALNEALNIAPLVKAIEDSNNKVIETIKSGNKEAKKLADAGGNIIVNIENKSTNQNIGGMV